MDIPAHSPDELVMPDAVDVEGEDFSGRAWSYISIGSDSKFERCNFSRIRVTSGGFGGGKRPTRYVECNFDGSRWRGPGVIPGRASFVRCTFIDVQMSKLLFFDAEFVDCTVSGTWKSIVFSAKPLEPWRSHNEFYGNDFSGASFRDVSFRGGVDLDCQRLPQAGGYLIVRNADRVLPTARNRLRSLPEAVRNHGDAVLDILESTYESGQTDLYVEKSLLGAGESGERIASLLVDV